MFNTKNDSSIKVESVLHIQDNHFNSHIRPYSPIMRFEDSFKFYMSLTGMTEQEVWGKITGGKTCDESNVDLYHRLILKWIDRIL